LDAWLDRRAGIEFEISYSPSAPRTPADPTLPDGICVTLAVLRRLKARSRAEGLSGGQFEGDGDNACGFIDRGDRGIDLLRTALRAAL